MGDSMSQRKDMLGTVLDDSLGLDLVDEFLLGDWQESPECLNEFNQRSSSSASSLDSGFSHLPQFMRCTTGLKEQKSGNQNVQEFVKKDMVGSFSGDQSSNYMSQVFDASQEGTSLAVGPVADASYASSIKERLTCALKYIQESNRGGEILVQIWMPMRVGNRVVLSTTGQPFWLDSSCRRLVSYRTVSMHYRFSTEENSEDALGLPGRVFVGELPEWTPDVRFFHSSEYPRVGHAQQYDVRGSIALPVFERGGRSCLGVIEVVMTMEKINYCSDLDYICKALQAVNLRSSETFNISYLKEKNYYFEAVLPEISEILRVACEAHKLPLAQTWIPCIQQGKRGSRHTIENYKNCISTADGACYVNDINVLGFQEACSEHHLFKGQGVAGKAFATNQPCFLPDITASHRIEYPLSHLAILFNLRGAVAIRLRSILAGKTDFVLEFFLPFECSSCEEQKLLLNSLFSSIHQVSQSLRVVTAAELLAEGFSQYCNSISGASCGKLLFEDAVLQPTEDEISEEAPPTVITSAANLTGISNTSEVQHTDQHAPYEHVEQEIPGSCLESSWEEEAVLAVGQILSGANQNQQDSVCGTIYNKDSVTLGTESPKMVMTSEKKRAKAEKAISLQLLQQYFAGSLKDAAKILGVCPSTLKRICRQYGITRWPSRKFKKVSHSLKKLQVVIDSVEGVDKSYQFSSLYANALNLSKSDSEFRHASGDGISPTTNQGSSSETSNMPSAYHSAHTSTSDSASSSSSQNPSLRNPWSSRERQRGNASQVAINDGLKDGQNAIPERQAHETCLHALSKEQHSPVNGSPGQRPFAVHPSGIQSSPCQNRCPNDLLGIKATYGEDKVRFKLKPGWGLQDLKQEIAKRFNIGDPSLVELKYLDNDSERVLLACDADLHECIKVYKSSSMRTIKVYVHICNPSVFFQVPNSCSSRTW